MARILIFVASFWSDFKLESCKDVCVCVRERVCVYMSVHLLCWLIVVVGDGVVFVRRRWFDRRNKDSGMANLW